MKILKAFVDFDKEEAWLNRKVAEGWLLTKAGPVYTFAAIPAGAAVVRVDYRPSMSAADFDEYRVLFADAGWQHLSGSRSSGAQYFASFAGDPGAEIFSDAAAKAQRYRRAMTVTGAVLMPFAVIAFVLWAQGGLYVQPYLTPGLWQMEGWEFARAFAFETPFALLRIFGPLVVIGVAVACAVQLVYQRALYRRENARTD